MTKMSPSTHLLLKAASGLALAGLLACGGGGGDSSSASTTSSNPASKLTYTDPTPSAGQWSLVKDAASTDTHLILDLVPPSDAVASFGVALTLSAGNGVTWSKVSASDPEYVHNLAYALGSGTQLIKGSVKSSTLTAGVFQKGLTTTPVSHSAGAVVSFALDLAPGANKTASVSITASVSKELQGSGLQPLGTLAVGTLALQ